MSERFLEIARQEIESELNSLQEIFRLCTTDQQLYERIKDIEKHLHKIKGLAPMMGEEKIGRLAKISDSITKQVMKQGMIDGSYDVISDSIHMMYEFFNCKSDKEIEDFERKVKKVLPKILDDE
ncbi:MAG: Hpt domain-containing protein [Thaumarchaeota archaeon]|nr:Hpt domain-containing protein [Nitrososphaerota archaeon]MDE1843105.1 Hpt domain-containing protein [Nitrososphaerota archaeon]